MSSPPPGGPEAEQEPAGQGSTKTALKDAAAWIGRVSKSAAQSASSHIETYKQQVSDAYGNQVAKQVAAAAEQRDAHRAEQEAAYDADRREQFLERGAELVSNLHQLTSDIQAELEHADEEQPLGIESYGVMMLVNIMVPVLENGLRHDWKSILPPTTMLSVSSQWAQNLATHARRSPPNIFDMLQAGDSSWGGADGESLGLKDIDVTHISSEHRRVQAWLFDSLNRCLLSARLHRLLKNKTFLEDWFFPWAVLRQEFMLEDTLNELVKIESKSIERGLIKLSLEQLEVPIGSTDPPYMSGWTQKMKDQFLSATELAGKYGRAAMEKASVGVSKVTNVVVGKQSSVDEQVGTDTTSAPKDGADPPIESLTVADGEADDRKEC